MVPKYSQFLLRLNREITICGSSGRKTAVSDLLTIIYALSPRGNHPKIFFRPIFTRCDYLLQALIYHQFLKFNFSAPQILNKWAGFPIVLFVRVQT